MTKTLQWLIPALAAAAIGCSEDAVEAPEFSPLPEGAVTLTFTELAHFSDTGISDQRRTTIRTEEEWLALWSEFTANLEPQPEAPAVDFATQMVIVATMGTRNTGGHDISIEGAFEGAGQLIVQVLEQSPGSSCVTTQALTAPAIAVLTPLSDVAVEFDDAEIVNDCD